MASLEWLPLWFSDTPSTIAFRSGDSSVSWVRQGVTNVLSIGSGETVGLQFSGQRNNIPAPGAVSVRANVVPRGDFTLSMWIRTKQNRPNAGGFGGGRLEPASPSMGVGALFYAANPDDGTALPKLQLTVESGSVRVRHTLGGVQKKPVALAAPSIRPITGIPEFDSLYTDFSLIGVVSSPLINDGQWHMVTLVRTYDAAAGAITLVLYIDGNRVSVCSGIALPDYVFEPAVARVGSLRELRPSDEIRFGDFDGQICQPVICPAVCTDEQVAERCRSTMPAL